MVMKILRKLYKQLVLVVDKESNNPIRYQFLNTVSERELLRKYMKNCVNYLEFGSCSTFEALKVGCKKVVSVESSVDWVEYMKTWKFIRKQINKKRLDLRYINIGLTREWGMPVDESSKDSFLQYHEFWFL